MNQYYHRQLLMLFIAAAVVIQGVIADLDVICQVADRGRYHVRVNVLTPVRVRPGAECSDGNPTKPFVRPQLDLGLQQATKPFGRPQLDLGLQQATKPLGRPQLDLGLQQATNELSYTIETPFVNDLIPDVISIVKKPTTTTTTKTTTTSSSPAVSIDGVENQPKRKKHWTQMKSITISNDDKVYDVYDDDGDDAFAAAADDDDEDDEVIDIVMRPSESRCADRSDEDQHLLVCSPGLMISSINLLASVGTCANRDKSSLCKSLVHHSCIGQQMCRLRTSDVDHECSSSSMLVDYECAPWSSGQPAKREDICTTTSDNTTLSCPGRGTVIRSFNFAYYGLIDGSCRSGLMPGLCSRNVQMDATKLCVGKNRCDVSADEKSFGHPCNSSVGAFASNATHEIPFRFAASYRCGPPTNDSMLGNSSLSARYDQIASLQKPGPSAAASVNLSGLVLAFILSIAFF